MGEGAKIAKALPVVLCIIFLYGWVQSCRKFTDTQAEGQQEVHRLQQRADSALSDARRIVQQRDSLLEENRTLGTRYDSLLLLDEPQYIYLRAKDHFKGADATDIVRYLKEPHIPAYGLGQSIPQ